MTNINILNMIDRTGLALLNALVVVGLPLAAIGLLARTL